MTQQEKLMIARQLSQEYGLEGRKEKEESRYDQSTGTLYVGSRVYKPEDLDYAKRFMQDRKDHARSLKDASGTLYEIAELAIERLMNECSINGGRLVVKEDGKCEK